MEIQNSQERELRVERLYLKKKKNLKNYEFEKDLIDLVLFSGVAFHLHV